MSPLCDQCREQLAAVFVTQITDDETVKFRLCADCARDRALESEIFSQLAAQIEDDSELMAIIDSTSGQDNFPDTFDEDFEEDIPLDAPVLSEDPFDEALFSPPENSIDPFEDDIFESAGGELSARCGVCGTSWVRIKEDGRCGCASCYETFREQLLGVLARVHRGTSHIGKTPTTAHKRRLHAQNLRKRRENQLALLQSRLKIAVEEENYEEAARIRDKIKKVNDES